MKPLGTLQHICFPPSICSTEIYGRIITYRITDYKMAQTIYGGKELIEISEPISICEDKSMWWENMGVA